MEEPSINIYVEAKNEYTKRLTTSLVPLLFEGFSTLYEDACIFKDQTNDPRYDNYSELQIFQDYLKKIPKWNNDLIEQECERIVQKSKCKYLDELLGAVIFSHIKVLSVIRSKNPKNEVEHEYPELKDFIHKCYKECSREIYNSAYLFDKEDITTLERQRNIRDIKSIIDKGILESISESLPYKKIIRTYIGKITADDEEDTTNSLTDPYFESKSFMKFLKKNKKSFMDVKTPTQTVTHSEETHTDTQTETQMETQTETKKVMKKEIKEKIKEDTNSGTDIEQNIDYQDEVKEASIIFHHSNKEESIISNHSVKEESILFNNSVKEASIISNHSVKEESILSNHSVKDADKEASIISQASEKNYKEIHKRQEINEMSTDNDLAQEDVKIVVQQSRHHSHHSHHKSKPNFMKEGPKYEEEL